jgi:hypothetical protein
LLLIPAAAIATICVAATTISAIVSISVVPFIAHTQASQQHGKHFSLL